MDATLNQKWTRSKSALSSEVDQETIILSIEADEYVGFEGVGSRIWELLETPKALSEICDQLMEEYEVKKEACLTETQAFLESLLAKKIVEKL